MFGNAFALIENGFCRQAGHALRPAGAGGLSVTHDEDAVADPPACAAGQGQTRRAGRRAALRPRPDPYRTHRSCFR